MSDRKACSTCGVELGPRNRSGYCRIHVAAAIASDESRRKISEGLRRRYAGDPELRKAASERMRVISAMPHVKEARRQSAISRGLAAQGHKVAADPAIRAKAGRAVTATRLAWCPVELREDYLRLIYTHRIPKAEARQMILDQHAADSARLGRELSSREEHTNDNKAEVANLRGVASGSNALLAAIRAAHPERFAA